MHQVCRVRLFSSPAATTTNRPTELFGGWLADNTRTSVADRQLGRLCCDTFVVEARGQSRPIPSLDTPLFVASSSTISEVALCLRVTVTSISDAIRHGISVECDTLSRVPVPC